MGAPIKKFKKKDLHISMDFDLYKRLIDFLYDNKSLGKSELLCNLIEEFLKYKEY